MELAMFTQIIVVTSSWFLFYVLQINRNSQIQIPTLLHAAKLSHPARVAQVVQWWPPKKDIYMYTWNPNDHCFDWKRPCFGGLTFKHRGHLGSRYIKNMHTYTYDVTYIRGYDPQFTILYSTIAMESPPFIDLYSCISSRKYWRFLLMEI